jgi:photosystem II stability/assembly factor-like uncharacterized protein
MKRAVCLILISSAIFECVVSAAEASPGNPAPGPDGGAPTALSSCAAGPDALVAVGRNGTVLTSPDSGRTWSRQDSGTDVWLHGARFAGGQFVAVGCGGTVLWSRDGVTWAEGQVDQRVHLRGISARCGGFIAVGENGATLRSDDGMSWRTSSSGVTRHLHGVIALNDRVVTVGCGGAAVGMPED